MAAECSEGNCCSKREGGSRVDDDSDDGRAAVKEEKDEVGSDVHVKSKEKKTHA